MCNISLYDIYNNKSLIKKIINFTTELKWRYFVSLSFGPDLAVKKRFMQISSVHHVTLVT
jgi:transposase